MGYQGDNQRCYKVSESLYSHIDEKLYHRTPSFTKGCPKRNTPTCVGKRRGRFCLDPNSGNTPMGMGNC